MPEEQPEYSDAAGTYPAASEALLSAGYHMGDLPPSSSDDDDYGWLIITDYSIDIELQTLSIVQRRTHI